MTDSNTRASRLAAYGAIAAGGVAAGLHADIQVYDGPPIALDTQGGSTVLSLNGVEFAVSIGENAFTNFMFSTFPQCCGYTSTGAGTFCTFSTNVGFQSQFTANSLVLADCGSDLASIAFQDLGDAIGAGGCVGSTFACSSSFFSSRTCNDGTFSSERGCEEDLTRYVGFTVMQKKGVFEGWAKIEGRPGAYSITRWAFQDDGGDIEVGEEAEAACDADVNGDGTVDGADLALVLAAWGDC